MEADWMLMVHPSPSEWLHSNWMVPRWERVVRMREDYDSVETGLGLVPVW